MVADTGEMLTSVMAVAAVVATAVMVAVVMPAVDVTVSAAG